MMKTRRQPRQQRPVDAGVALIMTLITLSLLTLIGLTLMLISTNDTMVLYNEGAQLRLGYAAESAIEEARDRMKDFLAAGILSAANPDKAVYLVADSSINPIMGDANSNPYFDPAFSSSVGAALIPSHWENAGYSWIKIIPKTEIRAGYSLQNMRPLRSAPVYYGYHQTMPDIPLSQYVNTATNATNRSGSPVFLATAFARDSEGHLQMVQADLAATPLPPVGAALYSRSAVNITGSSVQVFGDDENATQPVNLPGIQATGEIQGELNGIQGSPLPTQAFSNFSYPIDSLIRSLRPPIGKDITQIAPAISKLTDGSYSGNQLALGLLPATGDQPQTTFSDSGLSLVDSTGQGILVVNGDLAITGNFIFYGLIIVKGRVAFAAGSLPGIEIHGAVIANPTQAGVVSTLDGNIHILHNSAFIRKTFDQMGYVRLAIRRQY
jgi:hypothetical protein